MKTTMNKKNKAEIYDWANPGDKGVFKFLNINDLKIDHSYQRYEYSEKNTSDIAKNFLWSSCGTIVVMQRKNENYYIVDGQQRFLAVTKRGDIEKLPCMCFVSNGPEHEAVAFNSLNCNRRAVGAVQQYRASIVAHKEPEFSISKWLKENDFIISSPSAAPGSIKFIKKVITTWNQNTDFCKRALLFQRKIDNDPLSVTVHKGLFYLFNRGWASNIEAMLDKIIKAGGKTTIIGNSKKFANFDHGNIDPTHCARAIAEICNKGLRLNKINPDIFNNV